MDSNTFIHFLRETSHANYPTTSYYAVIRIYRETRNRSQKIDIADKKNTLIIQLLFRFPFLFLLFFSFIIQSKRERFTLFIRFPKILGLLLLAHRVPLLPLLVLLRAPLLVQHLLPDILHS